MKSAPAFWISVFFYLSSIAVLIVAQAVYGSWLLSIGLAIVWVGFYLVQGSKLLPRLLIPISSWKLLVRHFPPTRRVTETNADCIGVGTLEGCRLDFALVVEKTALTVSICKILFLWPRTITVPWDQIEIRRIGTNSNGGYVAVVSFPSLNGCDMVLPWRRKFAKILDHVEFGGLPPEP